MKQSTNEFACTYFGSLLGEATAWQHGPVFSYPNCGMYCAALNTTTDETISATISDDLPDNIRHQLIGYCAEQNIPFEGGSWPWPEQIHEHLAEQVTP